MRVAALYDIHGNLPALRAVLREVEDADVDRVVIGGDVLPGPLPRETLDLLRSLGDRATFVRGNGDRWVVEAFDDRHTGRPMADWTAVRIDAEDRDFLASFAQHAVVQVDGLGPTLFCHGSPRGDEEILTVLTTEDRWRPALTGVAQRVVVCGHTHVQFDRHLARWRLVNAGSVGMPYEGRAGAYWTLFGPDVEPRRTDYDVRAAEPHLRASGWPDIDELLAESFFDPVDPRAVAELFERQATAAG